MAVKAKAGAPPAPAVFLVDYDSAGCQIWTTVISEYNQAMRELFRRAGFSSLLIPCSAAVGHTFGRAGRQEGPGVCTSCGDAERATNLAESGHCAEALPLLKRAIRQTSDQNLKKRIGLDGLHCAMTHDTPYESLEFLVVLSREFPHDPEALYAATHAYSDLSMRSSQDLARDAPFSFQVHELNAEALEMQGKWDEAAAEYRKILEINPTLPGIHARLGRALLSKPQPSPAT